MNTNILLLGDSIIDNKVYLKKNQLSTDEVFKHQFREQRVHMHAVDGAVASHIPSQIDAFLRNGNPDEITHILLSAGGNDALKILPTMGDPVTHSFEAFARVGGVLSAFDRDYQDALMLIRKIFKNAEVCVMTVYNGNLKQQYPFAGIEAFSASAISMFNDVIYRNARAHDCKVLELREFFTDQSMYANPIEPSAKGSKAILEQYIRLAHQQEKAMEA